MEDASSAKVSASSESKGTRRLRFIGLSLSVLLCGLLALCYWRRPDSCAAVTVWPAWVWVVPGGLLASLGFRRHRKRPFAVVAILWLLYLLLFAEEATSLARLGADAEELWQKARERGKALRIVSLNCAGGSAEAAAEVAAVQPDIVLLQESPVRKEVEALAQRLYGTEAGVLCGLDASILARGSVTEVDAPLRIRGYYVQARVRLTSGLETEIGSLRLLPPVFREDLWSPECWREHTINRQERREQLRALLPFLEAVPPDVPLLIGGDFNAPAGDAVFRLLQPRLRDTFASSGRGWGNTIINDLPLLRIDQIWASSHFLPLTTRARMTRHSDHRMVICDLFLTPQ